MNKIVNEAITTNIFSGAYPFINKYIIENGDFLESRYGSTREVLSFKTKIDQPHFRCVGNNGRDMNVFFLIAEALWIWRGFNDVKTLEIFNSRMTEFSDDGKVFHAPYGFRLRHHGVSSYDIKAEVTEENQHHHNQMLEGVDQIEVALNMIKKSPETRRAVLQIWNADLDLGTNSKDLPCNDLVFLKVREGRLNLTISNRSNDLHWGLTTNLFQFSFLGETMSRIIDVNQGVQVHNSDSLHVYTDNPLTFDAYDSIQITDGKFDDLYHFANPFMMNFNFANKEVGARMREVDYHIDIILDACLSGKRISDSKYRELEQFCPAYALFYSLLMHYVDYKYNSDRSEEAKVSKLKQLIDLADTWGNVDILCLAQNFFFSKIKDEISIKPLVSKLISPIKL